MIRYGTLILAVIILFWACDEKVRKYSGFTQKEMEFLLASESSKVWERTSVEEDDQEIIPDECGTDNYLIFVQGGVGLPKPLLYAYNPLICDSLDFCLQHPNLCQSDTMLCNEDSAFCASLAEGILYIGSWYAKKPFIKNDRSDTLIFEINKSEESIFVTDITSNYLALKYKNRIGSGGGIITESYQYLSLEDQ